MEWKECKLERQKVPHNTVKHECAQKKGGGIPWNDIIIVDKAMMTSDMTCEVIDETSCTSNTVTKWGEIEYVECVQKPKETCHDETVLVPNQEYIHKKKCILNEKPMGKLKHKFYITRLM